MNSEQYLSSGGSVRNAGHQGKWWTLALLMVVGLFNYIDRLSMSILQVPIKAELGLSDTQIGALTGLAFSLVYTTMSIPIARLADKVPRRTVIVAALFVWSLMTAACGLATGFVMLIFLRMGVAIGEAGCVPASHAIISDSFPFAERARALAIYGLVFPFGTLLGFATSGWMSETFGWRTTFEILGLTGMVLAPLIYLLLKEPERGASDTLAGAAQRASEYAAMSMTLTQALLVLWRSPAFRYLVIGASVLSYPLHATVVWNPAFYHRSFDVPMTELSLYLALLAGGAGGLGLYIFGALADRLGKLDARWYMWVPAWTGVLLVPAIAGQYYFAPTASFSFLIGAVTVAMMNAFLAPMMAMCQALAGPYLRSLASASAVFTAGLIGTVLGPVITGVVSDMFLSHFDIGNESLRYAILTTIIPALLGAALLFRGAQFLPAALAEVRRGLPEGAAGVQSSSQS